MILRKHVPFRIPRVGLWAIVLIALIALPSWSQSPSDEGSSFGATAQGPTAEPVIGAGASTPMDSAESFYGASGSAAAPQFGAGMSSAGSATAPDSDQLRNLEIQLQQLLNQVQTLQAANQTGGMSAGMMGAMPSGMGGSSMMGPMGSMGSMMSGSAPMGDQQGIEIVESVEVRAYRTTYRLPEDKALAVQQFVAQHFASEVEARVEGNTLIVVTQSSQDEETMRRFIYLMAGVPQPPPQPTAPDAGSIGPASGGGSLPGTGLPMLEPQGGADPFSP